METLGTEADGLDLEGLGGRLLGTQEFSRMKEGVGEKDIVCGRMTWKR